MQSLKLTLMRAIDTADTLQEEYKAKDLESRISKEQAQSTLSKLESDVSKAKNLETLNRIQLERDIRRTQLVILDQQYNQALSENKHLKEQLEKEKQWQKSTMKQTTHVNRTHNQS